MQVWRFEGSQTEISLAGSSLQVGFGYVYLGFFGVAGIMELPLRESRKGLGSSLHRLQGTLLGSKETGAGF